jgi:hypothetical protein
MIGTGQAGCAPPRVAILRSAASLVSVRLSGFLWGSAAVSAWIAPRAITLRRDDQGGGAHPVLLTQQPRSHFGLLLCPLLVLLLRLLGIDCPRADLRQDRGLPAQSTGPLRHHARRHARQGAWCWRAARTSPSLVRFPRMLEKAFASRCEWSVAAIAALDAAAAIARRARLPAPARAHLSLGLPRPPARAALPRRAQRAGVLTVELAAGAFGDRVASSVLSTDDDSNGERSCVVSVCLT